jgi:O-antigen/teichoic acid export membrane protein
MASLEIFKTDHLSKDLMGRSVRGGVLTLTSQGTQFIILSISTVTLARLLSPADFGLVAMVTTVTTLAAGLADLGLSEATIQREDINHDQVSTLFWVNLGIGFLLTLATVALAPVFVWFYREPRLKGVAVALSLLFLINSLRVQPDALLKRQMRYSQIAIRDIVSIGCGVAVAIVIGWKGAGYWALVALSLTWSSLQMALSWMLVGWVPGPPRRDARVGSMVKFGGNVASSYFIFNLNRSADNVLIGWYWGAGPLGLYSRAYNLLLMPLRQINGPASTVAISALSRLQSEPERFARYYLRAVNLVLWIIAPLFAFLFVAAKPVIILTLGHKWVQAAPVFRILTLSALAQVLLESTIWLFVSLGQAGRFLKLLLVLSPIIVSSFAIGLPFGISGVALSGSACLLLLLPWTLKVSFHGTNLTLWRLGQAVLCPASLSIAGACLSEFALHVLSPRHIAAQFFVPLLSLAATYSLAVMIPAVRREILSFGTVWDQLGIAGRLRRTKILQPVA